MGKEKCLQHGHHLFYQAQHYRSIPRPMVIRKQLHDVLALTAELAHNNVSKDVRHTLVIDHMGLPEHETHRYIHELESLGLIKIQPQMTHTID